MLKSVTNNDKKYLLLAEKAWRLIQNKKMRDINKQEIITAIKNKLAENNFNLYQFVETV
jgi:LAO/AO transport system kinase